MDQVVRLDGSKVIRLQTRTGTDIPNVQDLEYSVHARRMQEGQLQEVFPLEVSRSDKRREASNLYNCHGMTFAFRRTGITELAWVKVVLRDDGYKEVARDLAKVGDVVLYFEGEVLAHSGIVVGVERLGATRTMSVMSKWGRGGEFIHDLNIHPYRNVTQVRFYRDHSDAS